MAGFFAGFGEELSDRVEERQKTLSRLIEENLRNGRAAGADYNKRKSLADTVIKSAQTLKSKYGLSKQQTLALAEAYGSKLPELAVQIDVQDGTLKSLLDTGMNADLIMNYVNTSGDLEAGKDIDLDKGIYRLMGIHASELAKEENPKSEAGQTKSYIRSALAYDPELRAAEKMKDVVGPGGLSYAQLLDMQQAGFAPDDIYGNVTQAGGLTFDYKETTARQTTKDYSSKLSTKIFDMDLTNEILYAGLSNTEKQEKAELKADVQAAGIGLARLEKQIVISFQGTDMSLNSFRKGILDDIYDRVDSPEELKTLAKSIRNGTALRIIEEKKGQLTDEDVDLIIAGVKTEEIKQEPEQPPEDSDNIAPLADERMDLTELSSDTDTDKPPVASSTEDPKIEKQIDQLIANTDEQQPSSIDLVSGNAAAVAGRLENNKERLREAMSKVTKDEWKEMSRTEREEKGLPSRPLDSWFAGTDAFKGGSVTKKSEPVKTESKFIEVYFSDILDYFDEEEVDVRDKDDVMTSLAAWFSENAEKLDIPVSVNTMDLANIIHQALNR
tara:strand:- start:815 stop:2482 length:1668 start_codon:yes stop_codon:yes gene_type:complete